MKHFMLAPFGASVVSGLVAPAVITPAARFDRRQEGINTCGYYYLDGMVDTISCLPETPCLVNTALSPAVGFCSASVNNVPVTSLNNYAECPVGCCEPGIQCCPESAPIAGKYLFDQGNTVFLGCGVSSFDYTAFFSGVATFAAAATSSFDGLPTPTAEATSAIAPITSSKSQPTAMSGGGSNDSNNSSQSDTPEIVAIAVGAAVALIGSISFLIFLVKTIKIYRMPYKPVKIYPNSSYPAGGHEKQSKSINWQLIVAVTSAILTAGSLAVAIVFGVKQAH